MAHDRHGALNERTERKKQQGSRTPTDASSEAAPAGAARTLRGALACRRSTAALARETAGPQGSASGHASRDGPERSILYGRSNRGAETLRVFAGVTRAGTTNERPSPASTSRAGHCAGRIDAQAARVRRGRTLYPRAPQPAPPALVTGWRPCKEAGCILLFQRGVRVQEIPADASHPVDVTRVFFRCFV